jgi:hypothetical protein
MWTTEGVRPVVTSTGSHQKTSIFGTISMDGRQFFRQYHAFNQYAFLKYLKQLERKFGRLILFIDRAPQHYRSIKVNIWKNTMTPLGLNISQMDRLSLMQ